MPKNRPKKNKSSPSSDTSPSQKGPILVSSEIISPNSLNKKSEKTRQPCHCEARQHPLINNCLGCGRIVCALEGSGSCFTCNALVCTEQEKRVLNSNSRESRVLLQQLTGDKEQLSFKVVRSILCDETSPSLNKAVEHKNKLLEYDQTVQRRTRVLDDEGDYYCNVESNKWLTSKQREILHSKQDEEHATRFGRSSATTVTLDFAGRQVVEEKKHPTLYDVEELLADDTSIFQCPEVNLDDFGDYHPEYCGLSRRKPLSAQSDVALKLKALRIQDTDLQSMVDEGMCLSMHQPYASLLIAGIKKHEGRSWYTQFRGRLWIHAGAKSPRKEEIKEVELFYQNRGEDPSLFPKNYPTGCLLGNIELIDCVSMAEYAEKFPQGEVGSAFAFICENPQELRIKIPMKGKHKIFKMDYRIHEAAKKTFHRIK